MSQEQHESGTTETEEPPLAEIEHLEQGQVPARRSQREPEAVGGSNGNGNRTHDREPEPVDANEIKDAVLEDLRAHIEAANATVEAASLPTVRADRDQLHLVLLNLMSNAIEFVPDEREPKVEVRATRGENSWCFAVEDNGPGLSPIDREGIFQRYDRGENGEAVEDDRGGLAACRRIVEENGGRIWVESDPGPGSTFHFTLPS